MKVWGINKVWCWKVIKGSLIFISVVLVFHWIKGAVSNDIYESYLTIPRPSGIINVQFTRDTKPGLEHVYEIKMRYEQVADTLYSTAFNNVSCENVENGVRVPCVDTTCNKAFSTPEDNLEKVYNYPIGDYNKYINKMKDFITSTKSETNQEIVLVTGATSEFFYPSQGLLRELHEKIIRFYNNVFIVYYDLGLSSCQRQLIQKYCRCEVKPFPFEIFPDHVKNLKNYAWKPLVINMELLQHQIVAWFDTSIRLKPQFVADVFRKVTTLGIMVGYGEYSLAQQTDLSMFKWFKEKPCTFSSFYEIQPGLIFLYRSNFVLNIIKPWISCALNKNCIAPKGYKYDCDSSNVFYGKCHRFDQSALSIILTRLFKQSRAVLHLTKFVLKKQLPVHYFPEEPSILCSLF